MCASMNSIGERYRFTSFGESHGPAVGGVIDGCPAGLRLDMNLIREDLQRRKSGGSARAAEEADEVEWLSGLLDGVTLGTPIAFLIRNTAARPEDYEALKNVYRPGHADYTYEAKYGIRDVRGGGRASARETAARVVAGAIAKQILREKGISIQAEVLTIGQLTIGQVVDNRVIGYADLLEEIAKAKAENDSVGGIVSCTISGVKAGIGEPIFDKVQARLAYAMLSINACKGFEYGVGFDSVNHRGSEINHLSGGIAGGITDGTDIHFRVVLKPTPSIGIGGRHDACVAVRAVPVVEAMVAMIIADYQMEN